MATEIIVVGSLDPSKAIQDECRVVDGGGIAPCVKENHGTVTAIVEVVDGVGKNKTSN